MTDTATETTEQVLPTEATPELPELRYEYQPKDEQGRKLGGVQVIKYRTQEELIKKFEENNVLLQRRLREEIRKNRTGQVDQEELPQESPKFNPSVELQPESLSADELIELARNMTDPAKIQEVYRRLAKAEFGAEPEKIRGALSSIAKEQENLKIRQEVDMFLQATPEYYVCKENWDTIYNWMTRNNLAPVYSNFKMAFDRLSQADILLTDGGTLVTQTAPQTPSPVYVQEGPDVVAVQPEVPASLPETQVAPPVAPAQPVQRISTALTNNNTTSATPVPPLPGSDIQYVAPNGKVYVGKRAIDAMPSDVLKERINRERGFKEKVDAILANVKIHPNSRW